MKYATLGPLKRVLSVQDTLPELPENTLLTVVELSDEQVTIVESGWEVEPKDYYYLENGELITTQQWLQAHPPAVSNDLPSGQRLAGIPLSKKLELAESFIESNGYTAARLVTCMDLLLQAKESGTVADKPKLTATYQWLQTVKGTALAGSIRFPQVPHTFEEVISE